MSTLIDFNNPPNLISNVDIIMIDTCTAIKIASADESSINFVQFALNNDIALCYSTKTIEEIHIISESNTFPKKKKDYTKEQLPMLIQNSTDKANSIINTINLLPNMYPEAIEYSGSDFIKDIKENSIKHNLRIPDSAIYTIAKSNGINCVWSHDSDWLNVNDPEMIILTEGRFLNNDSKKSFAVNK